MPKHRISHKTPNGVESIFPPNYRNEWKKHGEKFADAGGFEDEPAAATADTYGSYETRGAGMDGIHSGQDMSLYADNGEPTK